MINEKKIKLILQDLHFSNILVCIFLRKLKKNLFDY